MRIKRGTTRVAVLAGSWVIKFPRISMLGLDPRDTLHELRARNWSKARKQLGRHAYAFLRGVIANLTEFATWMRCRSPFLVPVFSVGFFSIQRYEEGAPPERSELDERFRLLPGRARRLMEAIDPHSLDNPNWRKNRHGFRLLDYGDSFGVVGVPLSSFLVEWHVQITDVLVSSTPAHK